LSGAGLDGTVSLCREFWGLYRLCVGLFLVHISECPFWHSADYSVYIYGRVICLFILMTWMCFFVCRYTVIVIPLDISIVVWDWILAHDALLTININDYLKAYNCKDVSDGCDE